MKRNAFTAAVCLSTALCTAFTFAPVAMANTAQADCGSASISVMTSDASDTGAATGTSTTSYKNKIKKGAKFTKSGVTYKITKLASTSASITDPADENGVSQKIIKNKGYVEIVAYKGGKTAKLANSVSWNLPTAKLDDGTVTEKGTFTVTSIGAGAFNNAKGHKITSVSVNKSIVSIGDKAFYGCKALKKITLKGGALRTVGPNSDKSLNRKSKSYVKNLYQLRHKKWKTCKAFKGTSRSCTIVLPNINATKGLTYNMQYANAVRLLAGNAGFIGMVR